MSEEYEESGESEEYEDETPTRCGKKISSTHAILCYGCFVSFSSPALQNEIPSRGMCLCCKKDLYEADEKVPGARAMVCSTHAVNWPCAKCGNFPMERDRHVAVVCGSCKGGGCCRMLGEDDDEEEDEDEEEEEEEEEDDE